MQRATKNGQSYELTNLYRNNFRYDFQSCNAERRCPGAVFPRPCNERTFHAANKIRSEVLHDIIAHLFPFSFLSASCFACLPACLPACLLACLVCSSHVDFSLLLWEHLISQFAPRLVKYRWEVQNKVVLRSRPESWPRVNWKWTGYRTATSRDVISYFTSKHRDIALRVIHAVINSTALYTMNNALDKELFSPSKLHC